MASETLICVTSYTDTSILAHTPKGTENSTGLQCYRLDNETGVLRPAGALDVGPNPAFVLQHPADPSTIYASTERIDADGEVYAIRLDAGANDLRVVDKTSARGKSTCYLALDASGRWLRLTNYWEATVCVLPVDGAALGERPSDAHALPPSAALDGGATKPRCEQGSAYCADANPSREEHWRYRQRWPHAHCVVTEPYAKQVHFVVDLGEDAIYHYGFDDAAGRLACRGATRLARGGGPRHVVFHPTKPAAFVVNELASTVSAFRYDAAAAAAHAGVKTEDDETAALRRCGAPVSTLPGGYDNAHHCVNGIWKAKSHSSEIRLDAAGDWLFVGNRGHDSLAVFRVSFDEAGAPVLSTPRVTKTGGKCPRNFAILPNFVVVGNQDTDELVVFARGADGALDEVSRTPHASPNYLCPLDAPRPSSPLSDDCQKTVVAPAPPAPRALPPDLFAPPAPPVDGVASLSV